MAHTKKTARQHAPPCQVVVSMVISRTAERWSSLVHLLLPFFLLPLFFFFCNMKPTGTEKIILSGGAGPLAGWLALRISLESSPRAALIGPSSSSTIEARTALATAPLFLTLGLGLVIRHSASLGRPPRASNGPPGLVPAPPAAPGGPSGTWMRFALILLASPVTISVVPW